MQANMKLLGCDNPGPVWGLWQFIPINLTLTWSGYYSIDFAEVNTTADVADWLFHCANKDPMDLYWAFHKILNPCKNCCSFGVEKYFSGKQLAIAYADSLRPKLRRRPLRQSVRYAVLRRDAFRCRACGAGAHNSTTLHVDHIIPVSKGGSNDITNLQTLCSDCNLGKGASL